MAYDDEEIDLDDAGGVEEESVVETKSVSKRISVSRNARQRIEEYFEEKQLQQLIYYDI